MKLTQTERQTTMTNQERTQVLSFDTRKAFCVQLGENAGQELANLLVRLAARLEAVERSKVSITPIVPGDNIITEELVHRYAR